MPRRKPSEMPYPDDPESPEPPRTSKFRGVTKHRRSGRWETHSTLRECLLTRLQLSCRTNARRICGASVHTDLSTCQQWRSANGLPDTRCHANSSHVWQARQDRIPNETCCFAFVYACGGPGETVRTVLKRTMLG